MYESPLAEEEIVTVRPTKTLGGAWSLSRREPAGGGQWLEQICGFDEANDHA
jgi:hypothetical protein